MYGYQWVNWEKYIKDPKTGEIKKTFINQIEETINLIKNNPNSRRMVVTAWNPSVLDEIALPSCHAFFIFNVYNIFLYTSKVLFAQFAQEKKSHLLKP